MQAERLKRNVDRLAGLLSDLHYDTHECIQCGWVDRADRYSRCGVCGEMRCPECTCDHPDSGEESPQE